MIKLVISTESRVNHRPKRRPKLLPRGQLVETVNIAQPIGYQCGLRELLMPLRVWTALIADRLNDALGFYELAARQKHLPSMVDTAAGYLEKKEVERGLLWYKKAAIQGSDIAQYELGVAFWEGRILERNETKAEFLWRESAGQGRHIEAMFNLGQLLSRKERMQDWDRNSPTHGEVVLEKIWEPLYWLHKACRLGTFYAEDE